MAYQPSVKAIFSLSLSDQFWKACTLIELAFQKSILLKLLEGLRISTAMSSCDTDHLVSTGCSSVLSGTLNPATCELPIIPEWLDNMMPQDPERKGLECSLTKSSCDISVQVSICAG